jgi:TetR/AcrR family transcriptional repressor of nem operon
MKDIISAPRRSAMGRPRAFDMEEVIARAVPVFREHGYEGASIDRLKTATGLTAGSLYKAFKDKRGVFAAAFAHYVENRQHDLAGRLPGSATGRERIADTLRFYLESASGFEGRQGCLVLASLIEATTLDGALHNTLKDTLAANRATLIAMLREGQEDGSIRADLSIEPCADLLISLLQGFRALGKLHDPGDHDALIAMTLKILD